MWVKGTWFGKEQSEKAFPETQTQAQFICDLTAKVGVLLAFGLYPTDTSSWPSIAPVPAHGQTGTESQHKTQDSQQAADSNQKLDIKGTDRAMSAGPERQGGSQESHRAAYGVKRPESPHKQQGPRQVLPVTSLRAEEESMLVKSRHSSQVNSCRHWQITVQLQEARIVHLIQHTSVVQKVLGLSPAATWEHHT